VTDRQNLQPGDLFYEEDNYYDNPCRYGYYYDHGNRSKLLIASDIGLTVKKADRKIHVFATNVNSARPISNLSLGLYSYQNQLRATKSTNGNGYVEFDSDQGSYLLGKHASGIALIELNHPDWQINNFDISGISRSQTGTTMFIYTDRGVYRPGDTIHLSAIIRTNNKSPAEKQPVLLEVKNPKGQVILNQRTQCGFNGHISFAIPTELTDPTGKWSARLEMGGHKFYHALKVETVKPNRLKITLDMPDEIFSPSLKFQGTLTTKYLFGAPAAGLRAVMEADISSRNFHTPKYGDYIFYSPLNTYSRRSKKLGEQTLDDQGQWHFSFPIPEVSRAPALLNADLKMTVYEKGGNFVQQRARKTIYPYTGYVGVKNVFDRWSTQMNQKVSVPIIVVDKDGKPLEGHRLRVRLYVNTKYWWYHYDDREQRDFRSRETTYKVDERLYQSQKEPLLHEFEIDDRGSHFLEVTDLTSGHQTGLFFYASRWGEEVVQDEKQRMFLQITSDKNIYYVGDKATLTVPTPEKGMIWFTLEKGDHILQRQWKPVTDKETSFTLDITQEMLPNCYVSISLIQPHNQNTNDLPMRLYGIKTLYVEDADTRLPLTLYTPEKLEPKKSFSIRVKSKSSRKATYTIAIVDEGLLDLTGFQTPSPWDFFFQKIRLMVRTCDNFEEIMGLLFPDMDKFLTIGGGMLAAEAAREKRLDQSKVQRFKPVALFQEPLTINPGETITTDFTMPNYVGAVRIMVVGSAGHSYVSLEETVPVKQPLMILPTIPRVVRPEDTFAVPVSVFALDPSVREVNVSLAVTQNLKIIGSETIPLTFTQPGEKDCQYTITTGQAVGADSITVEAVSGSNQADYTVTL
ncbi:MAG: MG2 domain-containing protein, partial [bacterium]